MQVKTMRWGHLGTIIKSSQLNTNILNKASIPIVFCLFTPRILKILANVHYYELSLNKALAEALLKKDAATRHLLINDEIMKIIASAKVPILLTNYEMLFDPRYDIDVIRLFNEISKRAKLIVKWCGTISNNRLEYATLEYEDYHSYYIMDYDIICVI
jgi:hypothetical protein